MTPDLIRHYRFARRLRAPDMGHLGERATPGARNGALTRTPAAAALALARDRIAARDALLARHSDVAASYDWTGTGQPGEPGFLRKAR